MVLSPRNKVVDEIVDSRLLSSMTRLSRAVLPVSHPHCQDSDATAGEALYSADFDGHTVKFDRSPESGNPALGASRGEAGDQERAADKCKRELLPKPGQCGVAIFHREMADFRLDEMTGELGRDGKDRAIGHRGDLADQTMMVADEAEM